MKKLVFISFLISANANAKQYCVNVPDDQVAVIETYVVDLEDWIIKAIEGKYNNRKEALFRDELQNSLDTGASLPKSKDDAIKKGMKRLGTRKERDAKEKAEREDAIRSMPTPTP